MTKIRSWLLLLGIACGLLFPTTSVYAQAQIAVDLYCSLQEEGISATDTLTLQLYNLSAWRHASGLTEGQAKKQLAAQWQEQGELQTFIAENNLPLRQQLTIKLTAEEPIALQLPRYNDKQDAAYLIVADAAVGDHRLVPLILFLPQIDPQTQAEIEQLSLTCKFKKWPDPAVPQPPQPVPKPTGTGRDPIKKLPQTGEAAGPYQLIGLLVTAFSVFLSYTFIKRKEDEK